MRLLVYGFGRYREFRDNITEKILRKLPQRTGLKKIVFPVRFHKVQFISAVKKHKPDVILGLGQCTRGRHLRIESQATNRRRNNPNGKGRPIITGEPLRLRTDLKMALGPQGKASNKAGDYVCNYSMYVILDFKGGVGFRSALALFTSLKNTMTRRRCGFWKRLLAK